MEILDNVIGNEIKRTKNGMQKVCDMLFERTMHNRQKIKGRNKRQIHIHKRQYLQDEVETASDQ